MAVLPPPEVSSSRSPTTAEENHDVVGRVYYSASTMLCLPHSLSQSLRGPALGAQAGEARCATSSSRGGFSRLRRASQTPFNLIVEARP